MWSTLLVDQARPDKLNPPECFVQTQSIAEPNAGSLMINLDSCCSRVFCTQVGRNSQSATSDGCLPRYSNPPLSYGVLCSLEHCLPPCALPLAALLKPAYDHPIPPEELCDCVATCFEGTQHYLFLSSSCGISLRNARSRVPKPVPQYTQMRRRCGYKRQVVERSRMPYHRCNETGARDTRREAKRGVKGMGTVPSIGPTNLPKTGLRHLQAPHFTSEQ